MLLKQEFEKVENAIKGKEEVKKSLDRIEQELKKLEKLEEAENKRLELIKQELDDSIYAKIFDIAIENQHLKEQLTYAQEQQKIEKYSWHNSPNLKIIIWFAGILVIAIYLNIRCEQNNILVDKINDIEKKMDRRDDYFKNKFKELKLKTKSSNLDHK